MDNLGCVAKYRVDSAPEDHFQSELHGYCAYKMDVELMRGNTENQNTQLSS